MVVPHGRCFVFVQAQDNGCASNSHFQVPKRSCERYGENQLKDMVRVNIYVEMAPGIFLSKFYPSDV